jgi:S1-C subfamily serine protease
MARTPKLSVVEIKAIDTRSAEPDKTAFNWKSATLKQLTGEEFSAYGIAKGDGGIAILEVPTNSEAAREGWRTGDVILKVGEIPTPTMQEFIQALQAPTLSGQPVLLTFSRTQQVKTHKLTAPIPPPTMKP